MPIPEGNSIPFVDSTKFWRDDVNADTSLSLFRNALLRSGLNKKIENLPALTIFAPKNQAFLAAGYTLLKIQTMKVSEIDDLLSLHITSNQINPADIASNAISIGLKSMYLDPYFKEYFSTNYSDYYYRNHIAVVGENILLNGNVISQIPQVKVLKGATIVPTEAILPLPTKDSRQILLEDPRFSMFMQIRRHNDSLYNSILRLKPTYIYETTYDKRYVLPVTPNTNAGKQKPVMDYLSAENYLYDTRTKSFQKNNQLVVSTIFVPTNQAFKDAGFETVEDFLKLNDRSIPEFYSPLPNTLTGFLATDSILNNHFWGINTVKVLNTNRGLVENLETQPVFPQTFYFNDLISENLKAYSPGTIVSQYTGWQTSMINPLEFKSSDNTISVHVKGSNFPEAKIIQKDIRSINGVIHVVDKLLIPSGFKLSK